MRQRTLKKPFSIDVTPFLGILAFIPLVVALVYIVATVRICCSCLPDNKRWIKLREDNLQPKKTTFIVCSTEGVKIYPGNTMVNWDELQRPESAVVGLLDKIETNKEHVVLLAQPDAVLCFRLMRKILSEYDIDFKMDVVDAGFKFTPSFEGWRGVKR